MFLGGIESDSKWVGTVDSSQLICATDCMTGFYIHV